MPEYRNCGYNNSPSNLKFYYLLGITLGKHHTSLDANILLV